MAQYKSILIRHLVSHAKKDLKCSHNSSHFIHQGESVLELIQDFKNKIYCIECAQHMVHAAKGKLEAIDAQFSQLSKRQPIS